MFRWRSVSQLKARWRYLLLSGAVAILTGAIFSQLLESVPREQYPAGYYALSLTTELLKIAGSTVVITGLISVVIDAVHWRSILKRDCAIS